MSGIGSVQTICRISRGFTRKCGFRRKSAGLAFHRGKLPDAAGSQPRRMPKIKEHAFSSVSGLSVISGILHSSPKIPLSHYPYESVCGIGERVQQARKSGFDCQTRYGRKETIPDLDLRQTVTRDPANERIWWADLLRHHDGTVPFAGMHQSVFNGGHGDHDAG